MQPDIPEKSIAYLLSGSLVLMAIGRLIGVVVDARLGGADVAVL